MIRIVEKTNQTPQSIYYKKDGQNIPYRQEENHVNQINASIS